MTKILLVVACCAIGSSGARSTSSTFWSKIDLPISTIHRLDWSRLSADTIQPMIPIALKRIEAEVPRGSQYRFGSCDGSTYMKSSSGRNLISFEFEKALDDGGRCSTRLRAIRADVVINTREAELLRLRVIEEVAAAGAVVSDLSEYQWRSDDSRTKHVLTAAISAETLGNNTKMLSIKLRHIPVMPETVDGLPFRKGYFPPVCAGKHD